MSCKTILNENRAYWAQRAPGYSQVNQKELRTGQHTVWRHTLSEKILEQFPGRCLEELHVLEAGTGPGFFAIILAELGCNVTAIDLTPNMLAEAKKNAGSLASKIRFMEMNAETLDFTDGSFDVIVTRNLTWNLPHPENAYREWERVLKPGGLLLNFDANWYNYLFDKSARDAYDEDRRNTAEQGFKDENVGENFDVMEDIARRIPLSQISRPAWDLEVLLGLGLSVTVEEDIWQQVWSEEEKVSFASTPMFLVKAVKLEQGNVLRQI